MISVYWPKALDPHGPGERDLDQTTEADAHELEEQCDPRALGDRGEHRIAGDPASGGGNDA